MTSSGTTRSRGWRLTGEVAAAERRLLAYYFRSARAADQYLYRRTPTGMPKEEGEGGGP